ncbi:hypothetical protein LUZ60_004328 [Juncus effusus]|nr:hypothetical protein LUZ60_004328 [Juncus effusus]
MEQGRYGHPHGWENNNNYDSNKSALETYAATNGPDFRASGPYNNPTYQREAFQAWPPTRNYDERETRRHDSFYEDQRNLVKYNDLDRFPDFDQHERTRSREFDRRSSHERERDRDRRSSHDRDRERDRGRRSSHERDRDRRSSHERERDYRSSHERERDYRSSYERERDHRSSHERERDRRSPHEREREERGRREDSWRSRSRSPRRSERFREGSYERSERILRDNHCYDDRNRDDSSSAVPCATILVRGLSHRTNEDDLYQILAEWGPLRHVRVIRERGSNIPRGFAFIDFPSVEAAGKMLDGVREKGLIFDGRKLLFDYSRESDNYARQGLRNLAPPPDWICVMCGCLNFARRILCFQCNEPRTEDALPADARSQLGKKGSESGGATHVLVVRGLDENADEEMLRYEFAKYAPVMDLRLVRDRFTHVSKGFAFVHFNTAKDATRALEATNGTTLEKNGQLLRVAFAKNIHGPGPQSQSSSLAAAAIEAATFSQQYDSVGWAPKEYNPEHASAETNQSAPAVQPGFVWDEKSGYYYDAASGFYYDGNTGLYYDGNAGIWYTFDQETQQYTPYNTNSNNENKPAGESVSDPSKQSEDIIKTKKVIISAPAVTSKPDENETELIPDAIQAAASAALAAEKKEKEKEKEKAKEIKISKVSLLANKKKMSNVLTMWKQRNQEAKLNNPPKEFNKEPDEKEKHTKPKSDFTNTNPTLPVTEPANSNDQMKHNQSSGTGSSSTVTGVIRNSSMNRGIVKSDTAFNAPSLEPSSVSTVFKAGGSSVQTGRRRFSEAPVQPNNNRDSSHTGYRDRAAERRNLYGSSSNLDDPSDSMYGNQKGSSEAVGSMPFPPGVGLRTAGEPETESEGYEVISADRALDESNVGNRILRNMGWQEGLGLGKDGRGITEPVQAKVAGDRSGLGSQQQQKNKAAIDPALETQPGDSYRTVLKKKTIQRFREMS